MKKLLFIALFSLSSAYADWGITGEFLYLKPSIDDTAFAIRGTTDNNGNPIGKKECNQFSFEPGFRVGGFASFCEENRMVEVYYTRLSAHTHRDIIGANLFGTLGRADFVSSFENYTGSARSSIHETFQRVDANFVQAIRNSCEFECQLFAGIQWADFNFSEDYAYVNGATTGIIRQKSSVWGVGPQVGLTFDFPLYTFCGCWQGELSFVTTGSFGLLAAKEHVSTFNELTSVVVLNTTGCDNWRVIPNFQLKLGFEYEMPISCYQAKFGIGYEFISYLRGLSREIYPDDVADSLSFYNHYNYDFQGLYVSGSVRF